MSSQVAADRIRRLRATMVANQWDFVLATSPESVLYLSGALIHTQALMRRRQCAVLVAASGDSILIVPAIEMELAARKSLLEKIVPYNVFSQTACLAATDLIRPSINTDAVVAIEKTHLPVFDFEDLQRSLPEARFVNADEHLQVMRIVKSADEIATMGFAAAAMEQAILNAVGNAQAGTSEEEIAASIGQHVQRLGGGRVRSVTGLVAAGANLHTAHHIADRTVLKPGDVLRVGCRAVVDGYNGIVNRTAVVGACSAGTLDHYRRVHIAHMELLECLRPGVVAGEIFDKMSAHYQSNGLSPTNPHFGYATGLEFQERPKLAPKSTDRLEAGMVILAESVSKDPEAGHIYIVDMVAIESAGVRNLSGGVDTSAPLTVGGA